MAGKHENEQKNNNLEVKKIKIFIHTKLNLFFEADRIQFWNCLNSERKNNQRQKMAIFLFYLF